jgi:hypothetical protein
MSEVRIASARRSLINSSTSDVPGGTWARTSRCAASTRFLIFSMLFRLSLSGRVILLLSYFGGQRILLEISRMSEVPDHYSAVSFHSPFWHN